MLDYGSGNVHSAVKALQRAGANVTLTHRAEELMRVDGLFVPGVGAFAAVMDQLRGVQGDELIGRRVADGRPVLGVCVGQQILFDQGSEHGILTDGLGEWPGTVRRLRASILPHMGWTQVSAAQNSDLFRGVEEEYFYFVHSYAATEWTLKSRTNSTKARVTWATHGERFIAAVENGTLAATQFHPEKSGEAGIQLLKNWIQTIRT